VYFVGSYYIHRNKFIFLPSSLYFVSPNEVDIDLFVATRTLLALIFFSRVKQRKVLLRACIGQDTGTAPQRRPKHWHVTWLSHYESAYVYDVFGLREFLPSRIDKKNLAIHYIRQTRQRANFFSLPTLQLAMGDQSHSDAVGIYRHATSPQSMTEDLFEQCF
jgi:hypothetical protein